MNNKGFTLVELIIVIGLLAVVASLFTINMTSSMRRNNEENTEEEYSELMAAADAYVNLHKDFYNELVTCKCTKEISVQELKDDGLISYNLTGISGSKKISVSVSSDGTLTFE